MNLSLSSDRNAIYHRLFSFSKADERIFFNPIYNKTKAYGEFMATCVNGICSVKFCPKFQKIFLKNGQYTVFGRGDAALPACTPIYNRDNVVLTGLAALPF